MRHVKIHSEAYAEAEEARTWYGEKSQGLGLEFLDEVDRAIKVIQESPAVWPTYTEGTRRFLLHRFPFGIIYQHDEIKIQIWAIMHLSRKPEYWKNRKKK